MNLRGQSPSDRLKNAGINYRNAAENIATGQMCAIFAPRSFNEFKKKDIGTISWEILHI